MVQALCQELGFLLHGGDPALEALPSAPLVTPVAADADGYVQAIATTAIGEAALRLGAGRLRKEDDIDHAVGIVCLAKRGDQVESGQPLAEVHAHSDGAAAQAVADVSAAYRIGSERPGTRPIVLDVIS